MVSEVFMKIRRNIILTAALCTVLAMPRAAAAQQPFSPGSSEHVLTRASIKAAVPQPRAGSGGGAAMKGAWIGAGAALAMTALAAARYGENEGGRFCGTCLVQWSVLTVPVGALVGAGVGYGLERSRRSVTATPVFSKGSTGIVIHARF